MATGHVHMRMHMQHARTKNRAACSDRFESMLMGFGRPRIA